MAQTTLTIDPLTLLKDAYGGSGGFKDGSYLFQHKRENEKNFEIRKSVAYYLNYVLPIINSHVDPIFRKEPARSTDDVFMQNFLTDVDMCGTSMTKFMKQAGFAAKLMGVSCIVLDNAAQQSKAKTVAEAKKKRQFPYAYIVTADKLTKWTTNRFGKLTSIIYSEPAEDTSKGDPTAAEIALTIKDNAKTPDIQYRIWTTTEWAVADKDGGITASGTHGLGKVPVTLLYGKSVMPGEVVVDSEFLSIAKTNLRLFNMCSELDEILRNQAFAVLTYPDKDVNALTVGVNNALGYNGKEVRFAPSFIAPPSAPAEWLMKQMDRLVTEMYRMAMLSHVTGNNESRTGAAKAWDFEAANKVLANFAGNCASAERDMADTFALWTKKDPLKNPFGVQYSSDFSIRDTEQELKEAKQSLELAIGGRFDIEVKKQIAAVKLKDTPNAEFDQVISDIEAGVVAKTEPNVTKPIDNQPTDGTQQ